jgi:hypothetical protein
MTEQMWVVVWRGKSGDNIVLHNVVVDAETDKQAIELAKDHFDDNADYYTELNPDDIFNGEVNWEENPIRVEVINELPKGIKKFRVQYEAKLWKTFEVYATDEENAQRIADNQFEETPLDNPEPDWCSEVNVHEIKE